MAGAWAWGRDVRATWRLPEHGTDAHLRSARVCHSIMCSPTRIYIVHVAADLRRLSVSLLTQVRQLCSFKLPATGRHDGGPLPAASVPLQLGAAGTASFEPFRRLLACLDACLLREGTRAAEHHRGVTESTTALGMRKEVGIGGQEDRLFILDTSRPFGGHYRAIKSSLS